MGRLAVLPPFFRSERSSGALDHSAEREQRLLGERSTDELQSERQALAVETGRHGNAGKPAMFTVTVNTSFKYISIGSTRPFSPKAKAAEGVVGVKIASTPAAKHFSKSRLISVRTFCSRR